jgi:hypothetical protein
MKVGKPTKRIGASFGEGEGGAVVNKNVLFCTIHNDSRTFPNVIDNVI